MPLSSSEAKTAEFARLFDLFEGLTSRRPRAALASTIIDDRSDDDLHSLPIPEELGLVLKNLSNVVRGSKPHPQSHLSGSRPRRNTVASTHHCVSDMTITSEEGHSDGDNDIEDEDDISLAKFPLDDNKYPFTFKHMVHKLYRKDEWAKAVKEMLKRSKNEFKPLAEIEQLTLAERKKEHIWNDGATGSKVGVAPGVGMRQRSQSVIGGSGRPNAFSPTSRFRSTDSGVLFQPHETRAAKKRCVGRRRSMSGPSDEDIGLNGRVGDKGRAGGSWVYAAAISSSGPLASSDYSFPPAPPPSPTKMTFSTLTYQPLGLGRPCVPSTLQNSRSQVRVNRRASAGYQGSMLSSLPLQSLTNKDEDRLVMRKRAMSIDTRAAMDNNTEEKRRLKRPFAG